MSARVNPMPMVLFNATVAGSVAVMYVYGATGHRRWFVAGNVVFVAFLMFVLTHTSGAPRIEAAPAGAIRTTLLMDGLGCLAGFVISYSAFMRFIGTEGARYMRVHADIELARGIHQTLVPAIGWRNELFGLHGISLPSHEVGGDLVDALPLKHGWIGYVADVSGHGVASGLLMGIVKSAIRTRLLMGSGLDDLLTDVNQVLCDLSRPNMYVTLAALHHDGADQLTFSVAGHLPILHYVAASRTIEERSIPQLPLGMFEDRRFASASTTARTGDLFALVTDGFTEVFDLNGNELGLERLKVAMLANALRPLGEIAEGFAMLAREHGQQLDDQTLLLVRVL
jgi:serine phosphatase RsbU (regulator of sigma subunit)